MLACGIGAGFAPGCAPASSHVELISYRDPYFPETFRIEFDQCVYRADPGGDYHIVARSMRALGPADSGPIVQLLHIHVFWRPWPGKTHDDASGVDATLRYVVASDEGATVFTGTGFVYPHKSQTSDGLIADLESGRLRRDGQIGTPPEVLGDARISGRLLPREDAGETVEILREISRRSSVSAAGG